GWTTCKSADLNNDRYEDLVIGNGNWVSKDAEGNIIGSPFGYNHAVLLNNGFGSFDSSIKIASVKYEYNTTPGALDIEIQDIDGDLDLDLFIKNTDRYLNETGFHWVERFTNDGSNNFGFANRIETV